MSLGGQDQQTIDLGDGVTLINKVGEAPFSYYGHRADGVYATSEQAAAEGLTTLSGYPYTGGDVRFRSLDGDKLITDSDREILGCADPDFFGGFHTRMSWKGFSLFANFSYSYGGKVYNGTRRYNELGKGLYQPGGQHGSPLDGRGAADRHSARRLRRSGRQQPLLLALDRGQFLSGSSRS